MSAAETEPTRLLVQGCRPVKTGTSQSGKSWTLYEVDALDPTGDPFAYPLKSFTAIPPGETDCQLERRDHERYGLSFTIQSFKAVSNGRQAPPRGQQPLSHSDPADRLRKLEERVSLIETYLQSKGGAS